MILDNMKDTRPAVSIREFGPSVWIPLFGLLMTGDAVIDFAKAETIGYVLYHIFCTVFFCFLMGWFNN